MGRESLRKITTANTIVAETLRAGQAKLRNPRRFDKDGFQ
jgi:hypothetical protein